MIKALYRCSLWLMAITAITFVPVTARAASYNAGDACTDSGAFHQNNASGNTDFLICDGSTWKSAVTYSSSGNNLRLDNNPPSAVRGVFVMTVPMRACRLRTTAPPLMIL